MKKLIIILTILFGLSSCGTYSVTPDIDYMYNPYPYGYYNSQSVFYPYFGFNPYNICYPDIYYSNYTYGKRRQPSVYIPPKKVKKRTSTNHSTNRTNTKTTRTNSNRTSTNNSYRTTTKHTKSYEKPQVQSRRTQSNSSTSRGNLNSRTRN